MINNWTKTSWRNFPILQQPTYKNKALLEQELDKIRKMPGIISFQEVRDFRQHLKEVNRGDRILLHMGDCAERFDDCNESEISKKQQFLEICSDLLTKITNKKVLKVGRIAGQYGKPRSQEFDEKKQIYNFKGDNINGLGEDNRDPDPKRLYQGYVKSLATQNCLRTNFMTKQLQKISSENYCFNYEFIQKQLNNNKDNKQSQEILEYLISYQQNEQQQNLNNSTTMEDIEENNLSTNSTNSCQNSKNNKELMNISHEGLVLDLEEASLKSENQKYYNLSSHFLWVGLRTNQIQNAHLEFMRGVENPIGIKVGPQTTAEQLLQICQKVNPENLEDKLVIIPRLGASNVQQVLPALIRAKQENSLNFIWMADGVHGNTENLGEFKVRKQDNIVQELLQFCQILSQFNENIGGISLESTYQQVTECVGGTICGIQNDAKQISENYLTACDPRLNFFQTLEVIQQFGQQYYSCTNKNNN